MGCGQSHISAIYPRKAKSKQTAGGSDESDEDCGGGGGGGGGDGGGAGQGSALEGIVGIPGSEEINHEEEEAKMQKMVQISPSPLLMQAELSGSQYDFFKMLDDKINNGPDYQPNCEYELTLEQSRLCRLLQVWQAAKQRAQWAKQGSANPGSQSARKLQRYHSLQSNGDVRSSKPHHGLQHQMSTAHYPPSHGPGPGVGAAPVAGFSVYPPAGYPPQHYQYQYPPQQYPVSNSVVMYDRSRGGYYTELA